MAKVESDLHKGVPLGTPGPLHTDPYLYRIICDILEMYRRFTFWKEGSLVWVEFSDRTDELGKGTTIRLVVRPEKKPH